MEKINLNVLIIGGGIGGLCLAQGLKKSGINFTVFEKNEDSNKWLDGYRIHVNPTGSSALHECLPDHLWKAFLAGTGDEKDGFAFMDEQLNDLVFIDSGMMVGYTDDPAKSQYAASRKMLRLVLQAGLQNNISYNKTFNRYEQTETGQVKVFFEDGQSITGDILIGADGSNSRVRMQLLPNARRVSTDAVAVAGKTMLNETTRKSLPMSMTSRMNVILPVYKYFFFSAAFDHKLKNERSAEEIKNAAVNAGIDPNAFLENRENYILWAFIAHKKEFVNKLNSDADKLKDSVLTKISNWHPDVKKLITNAEAQSLILLPFKTMLPIKNWESTNVTLIGDAVHNMPPLYGMGANMAMHDACLLCREIVNVHNNRKSLPAALNYFQGNMLTDGFRALNTSMKYTRQAISYNWLNRLMSHSWFRLCKTTPFIKKLTFGARWKNDKDL